jgi:hypothetical protein
MRIPMNSTASVVRVRSDELLGVTIGTASPGWLS